MSIWLDDDEDNEMEVSEPTLCCHCKKGIDGECFPVHEGPDFSKLAWVCTHCHYEELMPVLKQGEESQRIGMEWAKQLLESVV